MTGAISTQTQTVLVVEDMALVRLCTVSFLEDAGYSVLEAANGAEALDVLQAHPEIALLLTDVHMPGAPDGLELVRIAARKYPDLRSVVVSGLAVLRDDAIPGGGRFLAKPYSPEQVTRTLRQMLPRAA
jgi:two-component system, response regulator PdtaR